MRIFEKLFCFHDWEEIKTVQYVDCIAVLLKCRKCGRLVKKII